MFIDSRELQQGQNINAEVCIIGAGAAGITIAKKLARTNIGVCLIESGGIEFDTATQDLYSGEITGEKYEALDHCRLRFFGGSTNHWGGWTRPLDPVDFSSRNYGDLLGWPINEKDLQPYYKETDSLLQLGNHSFSSLYWKEQTRHTPPLESDEIQTCIYRLSPPARFGTLYGNDIKESQTTWCFPFSNVTDIRMSENGTSAKEVIVQTLVGNHFKITAYIVILAAGGIENPRLMLACNSQHKAGIGNQNDLVGRYFADHRGIWGGFFTPSNPLMDTHAYLPHHPFLRSGESPNKIAAALTLKEKDISEQELPNFSVFVAPENFQATPSNERENAKTLQEAISTLATRQNTATPYGDAEMPMIKKNGGMHSLIINAEPFPMRSSRVSLSHEKDKLGMQKTRLYWQNSTLEKEKASKIILALASRIGSTNLGRVYTPDDYQWPPVWQELGRHHMGTTRMSNSPKDGVVDKNCRVHGYDNLYVAGSSVFPTYGYAQPTYTIVALALRLADHIINTRPQWRK